MLQYLELIPKKHYFKNKISINNYEYNNIEIQNIIYKDISNFKTLQKTLKDSTNILYEQKHIIPENIDIFKPTTLNIFLCQNAFLDILNLTKKANIGIYNPSGKCNIIDILGKFSRNINVFSNNIDFYNAKAEELLENFGIYISLKSKTSILKSCNIIYAPQKIKDYIPTSNKTFIFTPFKPAVSLNGFIVSNFELTLPAKFKSLKPTNLSDTYFASALLELENCENLKKESPTIYKSSGKSFTPLEIARFINLYSTL